MMTKNKKREVNLLPMESIVSEGKNYTVCRFKESPEIALIQASCGQYSIARLSKWESFKIDRGCWHIEEEIELVQIGASCKTEQEAIDRYLAEVGGSVMKAVIFQLAYGGKTVFKLIADGDEFEQRISKEAGGIDSVNLFSRSQMEAMANAILQYCKENPAK